MALDFSFHDQPNKATIMCNHIIDCKNRYYVSHMIRTMEYGNFHAVATIEFLMPKWYL